MGVTGRVSDPSTYTIYYLPQHTAAQPALENCLQSFVSNFQNFYFWQQQRETQSHNAQPHVLSSSAFKRKQSKRKFSMCPVEAPLNHRISVLNTAVLSCQNCMQQTRNSRRWKKPDKSSTSHHMSSMVQ